MMSPSAESEESEDEETDEETDEELEEEEPEAGPLRRLFQKHRGRLASLTLVLFLALVAHTLSGAIPRETAVELPLGAGHAAFVEARVEVLDEEEPEEGAIWSTRLRFPEGAPAALRQRVDLSPGSYLVALTLSAQDGRQSRLRGRFEAPGEGRIRVHLRAPEEPR